MDHRPFEDWLLENKTLTPAEKRQLNAHLQACPSCTSLAEVDLALKSVRAAAPAAGFTGRFQVRLAARKKAIRRMNTLGYLLLSIGALGLTSYALWPTLKGLVQSPVNMLTAWLSSLISFWTALQAMFHAGAVMFKVLPGFVPAFVWVVILFAASGWSLVWIFSLIKVTKIPQGV